MKIKSVVQIDDYTYFFFELKMTILINKTVRNMILSSRYSENPKLLELLQK